MSQKFARLRSLEPKTYWSRASRSPHESRGSDSLHRNFPSVSEPLQFYLCHFEAEVNLQGKFMKFAAVWCAVNFPGRWSDGGTCKVGGM